MQLCLKHVFPCLISPNLRNYCLDQRMHFCNELRKSALWPELPNFVNMSKSWLDQNLWQKPQNFSFLVFYHFVKQKAENLCLINGHFKTISGHFLANCLSQNWRSDSHFEVLNISKLTKSYDILLVKGFSLHACKCMISGVLCEVSFWYLRTKSALIFLKWLIQRLKIPHFKDFGMINLKYEIRICSKNYNKVTMTLYFYYEIACIRR